MKLIYSAIAISVFQAYICNAASNSTGSTVVCEACPTTTYSSQFVTRTSAPTVSCSAPALTVISTGGLSSTSGLSASPTMIPITGAGNKMMGSMSGALAVAIAAVYVL